MSDGVHLVPLLDAAMHGDRQALDRELDQLADEHVAHLADVGTLLNLAAGLKLAERTANGTRTDHRKGKP
ncbi:hypothetical protein [Actinoplanes sp. NPDC051494]|uniref:hypothetical protein n=1 Tax=Actinoplanes sp. NPDC051494 TaxID=3363907 RepID=UPI0037B512D5